MARFDGGTGRRPSAEARRYVYAILEFILSNDLQDHEGYFLGGVDDKFDRRRIVRACALVAKEMNRKAKQ